MYWRHWAVIQYIIYIFYYLNKTIFFGDSESDFWNREFIIVDAKANQKPPDPITGGGTVNLPLLAMSHAWSRATTDSISVYLSNAWHENVVSVLAFIFYSRHHRWKAYEMKRLNSCTEKCIEPSVNFMPDRFAFHVLVPAGQNWLLVINQMPYLELAVRVRFSFVRPESLRHRSAAAAGSRPNEMKPPIRFVFCKQMPKRFAFHGPNVLVLVWCAFFFCPCIVWCKLENTLMT